jgi:hypothetical protein
LPATDNATTTISGSRARHCRGAGAVALCACLLWAGKQLYDTYQINREVAIISSEAGLSQRRYDDIVTTFPPIPTSNESLRRVIDRYHELEQGSSSPEYLWREISLALRDAGAGRNRWYRVEGHSCTVVADIQ